jgi:hypothetical protein
MSEDRPDDPDAGMAESDRAAMVGFVVGAGPLLVHGVWMIVYETYLHPYDSRCGLGVGVAVLAIVLSPITGLVGAIVGRVGLALYRMVR